MASSLLKYNNSPNTGQEILMSDTTIKKVSSGQSPTGEMGQTYLAAGKNVALRLWDQEEPGASKPTASREYETVGYVLEGKAELHLGEQKVTLSVGDSWLVPAHATHTYRIIETFTAIEATSPPARVHDRDAA